MGEYGQFCPVAKAAEVLDQRWTLLVIRELVAGSCRFNDIHRGVPRMSRSLLSQRLATLTRQGLVARIDDGTGPRYELTAAGQELAPVLEALGSWGVRWMSSLTEGDLDPALLVWDMHRRVDLTAVPQGRTVLALSFSDVAADLSRWWLVLTSGEVDVCDTDPGFGVDVALEGQLATLVRVWLGDLDWNDAVRTGSLRLHGERALCRRVPAWFWLSSFAEMPRPAAAHRRQAS